MRRFLSFLCYALMAASAAAETVFDGRAVRRSVAQAMSGEITPGFLRLEKERGAAASSAEGYAAFETDRREFFSSRLSPFLDYLAAMRANAEADGSDEARALIIPLKNLEKQLRSRAAGLTDEAKQARTSAPEKKSSGENKREAAVLNKKLSSVESLAVTGQQGAEQFFDQAALNKKTLAEPAAGGAAAIKTAEIAGGRAPSVARTVVPVLEKSGGRQSRASLLKDEIKEGAAAAVYKIRPSLAAGKVRAILQKRADRAGDEWLQAKRAELRASGDTETLNRLEAMISSKTPAGEIMDSSSEAREEAAILAEGNAEKLADFYKNHSQYLRARMAQTRQKGFVRQALEHFKDGTEFTAAETGLDMPAADKAKLSRRVCESGSVRGFEYYSGGLLRFVSLDGKTAVSEFAGEDGKKRTVETTVLDGEIRLAERGADGGLLSAETRLADGSVSRTVYAKTETVDFHKTADGKETFSAVSLSKDGFPKRKGRVVGGKQITEFIQADGKTVLKPLNDYCFAVFGTGKPESRYADINRVSRLAGAEKKKAVEETARALAEGSGETKPLERFINEALRGAPGEGSISLNASRDEAGKWVYSVDLSGGGTDRTLAARWESITGAEAKGLSRNAAGLTVYMQTGKTDEFVKIKRFVGENVEDRFFYGAKVKGNLLTGYKADQEGTVVRYDSGKPAAKFRLKTQRIYDGPSLMGHTIAAGEILARSAVQLTAAGMAVQLTAVGMAAAGVGAAGFVNKDSRDDLWERARANFFGNDAAKELGSTYLGKNYEEGYKKLGIDENRNVQNVGKEMAMLGRPVEGAVLQGGVDAANYTAFSIPATSVFGKIGKIGKTVSFALKVNRNVYLARGVYKLGADTGKFAAALADFNPDNPEHCEAVRAFTASVLLSPGMLMTAVNETSKAAGAVSSALKPASRILGADGRIYEPPVEKSALAKFVEGKNPGPIKRFFNTNLGIKDPKITLSAPNPVRAVEKWAAAKANDWTGNNRIITAAPIRPDAKIILPQQPNPDAKIIVP